MIYKKFLISLCLLTHGTSYLIEPNNQCKKSPSQSTVAKIAAGIIGIGTIIGLIFLCRELIKNKEKEIDLPLSMLPISEPTIPCVPENFNLLKFNWDINVDVKRQKDAAHYRYTQHRDSDQFIHDMRKIKEDYDREHSDPGKTYSVQFNDFAELHESFSNSSSSLRSTPEAES